MKERQERQSRESEPPQRGVIRLAALPQGAAGFVRMNELSLFSGGGGGLLGTKLLGWRTIGYVEWEPYCQKIIAQRIKDGIFDNAPIFGDVRAFAGDGCADLYRGVTDVVTAGFPCQPFSVAGKRKGADDDRNMWPATIDVIRRVRPRFALLENVPGLITSGYFGTVIGDLAESGYDCEWDVFSAAGVGAPHLRRRLWILADAGKIRGRGGNRPENEGTKVAYRGYEMADANQTSLDYSQRRRMRRRGHGDQRGREGQIQIKGSGRGYGEKANDKNAGYEMADAETIHAQGRDDGSRQGQPRRSSWWSAEPDVGRVAHGVADRIDRLKALGNGQVPGVVALAWNTLSARLSGASG